MNFRTSNRNQVKAEANMASISDLVFLLLIFFIILSTMVTPGVPIDPPKGEGVMEEGRPVSVTIQKGNKYFINERPVSKDEMETMLRSELSKVPEASRAFVLRVDKDVPSEHTVFVLDVANQNNWKVGIATKN